MRKFILSLICGLKGHDPEYVETSPSGEVTDMHCKRCGVYAGWVG